jgi:nitrite reductase/ring-hydroxylating ferredoxin subunit
MQGSDGWHRVAALAELIADAPFPAKLGETPIALYWVGEQVYALDDVCTHELALLSQGFVEGGAVECPLHGARFDIATGRCLAPPATEDLRTYVVRIDGGEIFVRMP